MIRSIIILLCLPVFSLAQLRINVPKEEVVNSAILQVKNGTGPQKGFMYPRVELQNKESIEPFRSNPTIGTMVFNTLVSETMELGVYNWNGTMWELSSNNRTVEFIAQKVDPTFLGYKPLSFKPEDVTIDMVFPLALNNGITKASAFAELVSCMKWVEGNNNTYCLFNVSKSSTADVPLDQNLTWFDAFNFAKQREGHLVTITEDSEWEFLKNNLLNEAISETSVSNKVSWIGFIRSNMIFSPTRDVTINRDRMNFGWITDELSVINWNNTLTGGRTTQNQFEDGYPFINFESDLDVSNSSLNTNDVTNYAAYIRSKQPSTERLWRVINSNGINEMEKIYLDENQQEKYFPNPFSVTNGNRDNFKSASIIVEYTQTK